MTRRLFPLEAAKKQQSVTEVFDPSSLLVFQPISRRRPRLGGAVHHGLVPDTSDILHLYHNRLPNSLRLAEFICFYPYQVDWGRIALSVGVGSFSSIPQTVEETL